MSSATGHGVLPGDLARRIHERREQLGMTPEQLATRAEIDPGYLEYLEHRAGAIVTAEAMLRLAAALETTLSWLAGAQQDGPGGWDPSEAHVAPLNNDECLEHLRSGDVGRVIFRAARGPVAYPVNYVVVGEEVVFSTSERTASCIAECGEAGFEVDNIDLERHGGWSVIVTGPVSAAGSEPDDVAQERGGVPSGDVPSGDVPSGDVPGGAGAGPDDPDRDGNGVKGLHIQTWAGTGRDFLVRIRIAELTGRAIAHHRS
jgi:transcriptional regulator with XRE-family HTH domain